MPFGKLSSLIKGHHFNSFVDKLSSGAKQVFDIVKPVAGNFVSAGLKAFEGAVNNQDNWGMFGTLLANKAIDLLTAPKNTINPALPPTEGSIVTYAPALSPSEVPVIVKDVRNPKTVQSNIDQPFVNSIKRPVRARRILVRRKKPIEKTGSKKTVSELVGPKKKKKTKKYRYKGEI